MDLRQSIAQTNTLLLPPKPYSIPPISSLPLNPKPVGRGRTARAGRIKCSFDYNVSAATNTGGLYDYERHAAPGSQYPRPAEIQWKKELCNSVQLIGLVGAPVQIKHLPSGKVVAWSRIAVKKSPTDTVWVNLTFWDELANVAFEHVEKGNQIYVSGRLISDTVENDDGKKQTYYKVVVQQLNFVEQSFSSSALHNGSPDSATSGKQVILKIRPVMWKNSGKPSLLILWNGGITVRTREAQTIRTSSTKTPGKHCGWKAGTIHHG
ncbi:uncharacterized protein LOC127260386 isoform X2 [Andrographis paniculata]|uniref:uncharacterized protein LOC127260386 isoform X2 n=1 Tax=Andrographis paniculata TaxID=175694 RepID=UPI0021E790CE|nr:uncharacterized protein LOC127260386 isoform X2 [Andrographis paniculata]